ncbi:type II CAAX endopeptidase family protein [Pseudorhodoplanes sp.]|uniref:CPBP family intramembrane glutamic endopeptidase n=1 Tax=Pseudorhodoplanes sp. TaxID=1934341 RepID=UPI002C67CE4F|nr:type II CAAX endopeptidase family protein [Pseudorhodoplanes sp.]HWV53340.1 type II CAAX endopeptidase family protein [Pseudorhodoplanes sp.]
MTEIAPKPHEGSGLSPCQPWGFWATTAIGLAATAAWFAAQLMAAFVALAFLGVDRNASDFEVQTLTAHALTIAVVTILSMPAPIAVIAMAARYARCSAVDYLALYWPRRADLIVGIVIIAVLLPLGDLTSYLSGRDLVPPAVVDAYRSARSSGTLVLFAVALIVAAPLMEELLFRGFIFPGYARSRLGPWGAILLTSAGWAVMHVQYETFYIVQIFVLGCVLGWLRWSSGSTLLTVILHAIVNTVALVQVAFVVERAG